MNDNSDPPIKKRKRDPVFEMSEKCLLVQLVTKHYGVLECKKTDGASMRKKIDAWKKICDEYNASSNLLRTWSGLKMLWENLKRRGRQVIASQNDNAKGTGTPLQVASDPIIEMVVALIRPGDDAFSNSASSNYNDKDKSDDEGALESPVCKAETSSSCEEIVYAVPSEVVDTQYEAVTDGESYSEVTESSQPVDWTHYSPAMHKGRIPYAARVLPSEETFAGFENSSSRRRPLLNRSEIDSLIESKLSSPPTSINRANEEHAIQMRILQLRELQEKDKLLQEKEKLLQEKEKLKQEKMKTELLRIQLQKVTKHEWMFNNEDDQ